MIRLFRQLLELHANDLSFWPVHALVAVTFPKHN